MAGQIVPYRPTTQADRDALVKPVAQGLRDLVLGSPGLFDDRPGFIAAPPGGNPLVNAVRDISQFNCRRWAAADKSNFSSRVNTGNAALCGPYLDGLGENPDDGDVGPLFSGGQCPVRYFVVAEWQSQNTDGSLGAVQSQNVTGTLGRPGPIRGIERRGQSGSWQMVLLHGTDSLFTSPESVVRSSTSANQSFVNLKIKSVSRVDGQADNCGQPLPSVRAPATVTPATPIPPSITVNIPGFGPVSVTVGLDGEGDPVVCFEDIQVCVPIKPESEVEGGGGQGGAPPFEPVIGDPIDGPPGGSGSGGSDTPFGPPPEGRIWAGAFVQIVGEMSSLGVVPGSVPGNAAITKVAGNASLIIDNGLIARVRSRATQIRSEWSEHLVAYPGLTVNGIRVNMNPALGYRVYPVSIKDPVSQED